MTVQVGPSRVSTGPGGRPPAQDAPRGVLARLPRFNRAMAPYLFLLPALCLELLVHIVPMLVGTGISFLKLTQFYIRNWLEAPPAGLSNYSAAFQFNSSVGKALLYSFGITIAYALLVVVGSWVLGFGAALLLQRQQRGRGLLRALFLVPYALPAYTAVITWNFIFQRDTGMLNHLLVDNLHLVSGRPFWLIGGRSFASIVVVAVWRHWPFAFLTLMAGLQNISAELYEAAEIDGATLGQQIRGITLPMLRPVNQVLVLVLFLWTFNDFNTPFVLFGAAPPQQADLLSIHIYSSSFVTWNFGLGSAMSVLMLLFLLLVTAVYLLVTSRGRRHAV